MGPAQLNRALPCGGHNMEVLVQLGAGRLRPGLLALEVPWHKFSSPSANNTTSMIVATNFVQSARASERVSPERAELTKKSLFHLSKGFAQPVITRIPEPVKPLDKCWASQTRSFEQFIRV